MSATRPSKKRTRDAKPASNFSADRLWDDGQGIISFYPPANPTPEEQKLVCDFVILDHLKQNQLKEKSREWGQVHKLLLNVIVLLNARDPIGARTILEEAREVYLLHNQSQNRIRYLIGAVAGIFVAAILGAALFLLSTTQAAPKPFIDPQLLILILVFAGIGSATSILTRLSSIDLRAETSTFSVYVSGLSRPFVAISFAVVVYFILDSKAVDVTIGRGSGDQTGVYIVTSFLCGFSERFAKDIISRISPGDRAVENEKGH